MSEALVLAVIPPAGLAEGGDFADGGLHGDIEGGQPSCPTHGGLLGSSEIRGKSPQEVELAASRIKLGEKFADWDDFDYCLNSWCVKHGRAPRRKKTEENFRLAVCRFHSRDMTTQKKRRALSSTEEPLPLVENILQAPTRSRRRIGEKGACGETARKEFEGVEPCRWRVRATRGKKTGQIVITVCILTHTCPENLHKWRAPAHKARWLATTLVNKVVGKVKISPGQLEEEFLSEYNQSTPYHAMHRCKRTCTETIMEKCREDSSESQESALETDSD